MTSHGEFLRYFAERHPPRRKGQRSRSGRSVPDRVALLRSGDYSLGIVPDGRAVQLMNRLISGPSTPVGNGARRRLDLLWA
jgi:hypothetical protein